MYAPVSLLVAGLVFGALTLMTVQESPQFSVAGLVPGGIALLLTSMWLCLMAAAGRLWWDSRPRRAAVLLALAGLSWLVPEWDSPFAPALLYATALVLAFVTPALVLHSALTWSNSRLNGVWARATVASGYIISIGLLGLLPALVFDPAANGCVDCPGNPWLVQPGGDSPSWLGQLGLATSAIWLVAAVCMLGREVSARVGQSRHAAVPLASIAFLLVVAVRNLSVLGWDTPRRSLITAGLWFAANLALVAVAVGATAELLARRRARHSLGRIVLGLAGGQQPGLLREGLAQRLGDPTVELLYLNGDGTMIDALGHPFAETGPAQRQCVPLSHGDNQLGFLRHSVGSRISSEDLRELVDATHLGLEHEALTARALAEERELRDSGLRLLAARDGERRRLERDLHDGAQQRLVGLALGLQLLGRGWPGAAADTARERLALAIDELRDIAHGLSPPVLTDAGLIAALKSLAETRDLEVVTHGLCRLEPTVETTVYQLIEVVTRGAPAAVDVECHDSTLRVRISVAGKLANEASPADRIVTLGGCLSLRHIGDDTVIEIDLPVTIALGPPNHSPVVADAGQPNNSTESAARPSGRSVGGRPPSDLPGCAVTPSRPVTMAPHDQG